MKNKETRYNQIKNREKEIYNWFIDYKKGLSCIRCDDNRFYVLDFHHEEDDKEFDVSRISRIGYSKKAILKEVEKCIPVCANCHRELHYLKET